MFNRNKYEGPEGKVLGVKNTVTYTNPPIYVKYKGTSISMKVEEYMNRYTNIFDTNQWKFKDFLDSIKVLDMSEKIQYLMNNLYIQSIYKVNTENYDKKYDLTESEWVFILYIPEMVMDKLSRLMYQEYQSNYNKIGNDFDIMIAKTVHRYLTSVSATTALFRKLKLPVLQVINKEMFECMNSTLILDYDTYKDYKSVNQTPTQSTPINAVSFDTNTTLSNTYNNQPSGEYQIVSADKGGEIEIIVRSIREYQSKIDDLCDELLNLINKN